MAILNFYPIKKMMIMTLKRVVFQVTVHYFKIMFYSKHVIEMLK